MMSMPQQPTIESAIFIKFLKNMYVRGNSEDKIYMYSIKQQHYKEGMSFKMVLPCANTNNCIFKSKILDPISLYMPFSLW